MEATLPRDRPALAPTLAYALVTPARNEEENLQRLADCVARQTVRPIEWIIVENGSTDGTPALAQELARELEFVRVIAIPERAQRVRGGAIVRALVAGIEALERRPDIVVNLDADVSV